MDKHKKAQLTLYNLFLLLLVFWTFLFIFGSIFGEAFIKSELMDYSDSDLNEPLTFFLKFATFRYPEISPIATIIFDGLILLTIYVGIMTVKPGGS